MTTRSDTEYEGVWEAQLVNALRRWEREHSDIAIAEVKTACAALATPPDTDPKPGEAFALDTERSAIPDSLVRQIIEPLIGLTPEPPDTDPSGLDVEAALDAALARTDDEEVAYFIAQARTGLQRAALSSPEPEP